MMEDGSMKEFKKTDGGEGCAGHEVHKSQPECCRKFRLCGFPGLIN